MRYITILLFGLLSWGCKQQAATPDIDLVQEGPLFGKVKTLSQRVYGVQDSAGVLINRQPKGSASENFLKRLSPDGMPLEEYWYDKTGAENRHIIYEYAEDAKPLYKRYYLPDGKLEQRCTFQYDQTGSLDQLNCVDTLDQKVFTYRFNPNGRLSENTFFLNDSVPGTRIAYQYNEMGQKIEEFLTVPAFNVQNKWIFQYGERGELVKKQLFDAEGTLLSEQTFEYTYDDNGNWVRQRVFREGRLSEVKERKIEYY